MSVNPALPADLANARRHIFLSPHYDDIPLSVGATVRLLADNGFAPETHVVFGSEPDRYQPLSAFAESLHSAWGLSAEEVIHRRKAEEDAAAAILGARSTVLPFHDAIYRGDLYLSDDDLFGAPASDEGSLPKAIISALNLGQTPDPATRLYAPLGVGRHVDHQVVFQSGVDLASRGWDVWFYEDIPYALRPRALESRLADLAASPAFTPAAMISAESGWEAKLDAILCYPSQLQTVFQQYVGVGISREEIDAALRTYATHGNVAIPAERFWRVVAKPTH